MSFLTAMQKTTNATEGAAAPAPKKVNPLLAKAKPNPLTAKKEEAAVPTETEKAPAKKPSPLLKKKDTPAPEEKTVKEKAIEDAKKQIVEEVKAELIQEEENQETTPVVEEADVEVKEEVVEEVKAETVPEETVTKPKSKRNAKKKTPKVADETQDTTVQMYSTQMSFADAMAAIRSPFVDEEWENFKQEIAEELNSIEINSDMNAATMKQAVADLSAIRQKVWFDFQEVKTQYDSLASKEPEGIIERVKKVNIGDGSNDLQRKKAGVEACMRYVSPGTNEPINLFELLDEVRGRFNFLKNVLDSVEYKTKVLITMSSALKLEGQHIGVEV